MRPHIGAPGPSDDSLLMTPSSEQLPSRRAPYQQPPSFLLMAVWFGVLSGLAEVSLLAVKKYIGHRFVPWGLDISWMAPLADVLILAVPALALSLVGRSWPQRVRMQTAAFVFVFLGSFGPLRLMSLVNDYTALILAAGVAVQAARLIVAHADGFYSLLRRTLPWMVAFVVALVIVAQGWPRLAERRALAALPPASPNAANVLLIVLDTVRAQSLGLYGYARRTTPHLERLAKAGVSFERAITPSPWTLPAHASMFTGRFPHEHSAEAPKGLDATFPTLAEVLSARGYLTAGFVANLFYCTRASGLSRGFAHYEDYRISPGQIALSSSLSQAVFGNIRLRRLAGYHELLNRKDAERVNRDFLRWLSSRWDRRPFFAFLNYLEAHAPYLPPKPFDDMFGAQQARRRPFLEAGDKLRRYWPAAEVQTELDAYDGAIAYLDHQIGQLFDELERRGALRNTVVIITSDHGEEFFEHGLMSHGSSLYRPSLHVPLLISFPPHVPAGKTVHDPVTLRDLPATVVDLLKLEGDARFPGSSLARHWAGGRDPRRAEADPVLSETTAKPWKPGWFPVHKGDMQSLVDARYHYVRNGDGREELYDVRNDPWEQRDLSGSVEASRVLPRFRASLKILLARNGRRGPVSSAPDVHS